MTLSHIMARLAAHFDAAGLGPSLYLVEWVLTLFAKALPLEPVRRGSII